MKLVFLFAVLSVLLLSASDCSPKKTVPVKYKGRLEIAAICMNYTISVTEGTIDTSKIASSWTDETTGKSYKNVFKPGNPCDFPASIKQGDEFYFLLDTAQAKPCAVCMAYYPTPAKVLSIKVADK